MDIESMAWRVIEKYWKLIVPVDVHEIARRMKITIVSDPFLPVSGEFSLEEKNRPLIRSNTSENPLRQKFTLAHALGHYLLHAGNQPFFHLARERVVAWQMEHQAWDFAFELFIPRTALVRLMRTSWNDADLREHFQVSEEFFIRRMQAFSEESAGRAGPTLSDIEI